MIKKDVVCMLGLFGSGKNYQAQKFIQAGYKEIAFADPLRKTLYNILGYTPEDYDLFKKSTLYAEVQRRIFKYKKRVTTGRTMLQNLGTVFKQLWGEGFWAKQWYKSVLECDTNVVCSDVRFPIEIKKAFSLKKKGMTVDFMWCCYDKADFTKALETKHESERLAQFMYYNRDKYKLHDGDYISEKTLRRILKDFEFSELAMTELL